MMTITNNFEDLPSFGLTPIPETNWLKIHKYTPAARLLYMLWKEGAFQKEENKEGEIK